MSGDSDVEARRRAQASARQARWRAKNKAAAVARAESERITRLALAALVDAYPFEYAALVAEEKAQLAAAPPSEPYRRARVRLRKAHADEYATIREGIA